MLKSPRKRAGAKISIILLSVFLFLLFVPSLAFASSLGDVNDDGRVDVRDVVKVMKHVLSVEKLDEDQKDRADVNGDGVIDVKDVSLIMQYALNIIDEFPHDPELRIDSVKALTPYKLLMEFNMEIEEPERGDIEIRDEEGNRLFVSRVELVEDDEALEVRLFNALEDGEEYDITATIDDVELEYTFLYEQGEVVDIEVEGTNFVTAADRDFEMGYKLMTDTGVDVSTIKDVKVRANIPSGQISAEDGVVTIDGQEDEKVVLFRLSYDNDDEIESDQVRVLFAAEFVETFGTFTIVEREYWRHTVDWDEDDLFQWINVGMSGYFLVPELLDQFGDEVTVSEETLRFTSFDPDKLVVDRMDGALTPREEGEADIRVEHPTRRISTVYTVDVLPEVELTELVFADSGDDFEEAIIFDEIEISTVDDELVVYVWMLDQYERPYAPVEEIEFDIEVDDEDVVTTDRDSVSVEDKHNFYFKLEAGDVGDTVVTVENGDVSAELSVEVFEPGVLVGYQMRGVTNLDLYENDVTNEMTVRVYPVDEDGFRTGDAELAHWEVDGDQISILRMREITISTVDPGADYYIDEEGTYKITAEIEDYKVEETFEVVDTTPPYKVEQISAKETVDQKEGNVIEAINEALEVTRDGVEYDVEEAKFISDNRSVIPHDAKTSEKPGEATIYITELTVNGKKVEVDVVLEVVVEYEPEVDAGNSEAEAVDNEDSSATITITVRDQHDNPYEELGMDDIKLHLYDDPDRVAIDWETLSEIDDRPAYTASIDEQEPGIYTVIIECTANWTDGKMDVEADGVEIETGAEFKLTGN